MPTNAQCCFIDCNEAATHEDLVETEEGDLAYTRCCQAHASERAQLLGTKPSLHESLPAAEFHVQTRRRDDTIRRCRFATHCLTPRIQPFGRSAFWLPTGERVRLVRNSEDRFELEDLMTVVVEALRQRPDVPAEAVAALERMLEDSLTRRFLDLQAGRLKCAKCGNTIEPFSETNNIVSPFFCRSCGDKELNELYRTEDEAEKS